MTSVQELIEQAKNYIGDAEDAIRIANKAYGIVHRDIMYAQERLGDMRNSDYPNLYARSYMNSMLRSGIASDILKQEIDKAITINEEFDRTMYRDALHSIADNAEIFNFVPISAGWGTRLSAVISFESAAGSLEDWARGISGYRDELGVDDSGGENRGAKATRWWLGHVYKKPLEVSTFHGRISYAGRPAPFWQILNSGSPSSLPSDREGAYNPVQSTPTDFIGEAELRLVHHFAFAMSDERAKWDNDMFSLEAEIREAEDVLREIEELIESLKADEKLDRAIIAELNKRSRSGDISEYTDRHKLREAVKRHNAGEKFTSERVELTARNNAGRRVRPRVGSFIRAIESYGEL